MGDIKADDSSAKAPMPLVRSSSIPSSGGCGGSAASCPISSKTFDVLVVLLEHRDHSVSKDELLNLVWPDTAVNENNLARQISSLRRALGQRPDEHDFVVTIPGHGYRFVATVRQLVRRAAGAPQRPNGHGLTRRSSRGRGAARPRWLLPPAHPATCAADSRPGGGRAEGRWLSLGIARGGDWCNRRGRRRLQLRHRPVRRPSTRPAAHHLRRRRAAARRGLGAGRTVDRVRQRPRRQRRPLEAAPRRARIRSA